MQPAWHRGWDQHPCTPRGCLWSEVCPLSSALPSSGWGGGGGGQAKGWGEAGRFSEAVRCLDGKFASVEPPGQHLVNDTVRNLSPLLSASCHRQVLMTLGTGVSGVWEPRAALVAHTMTSSQCPPPGLP